MPIEVATHPGRALTLRLFSLESGDFMSVPVVESDKNAAATLAGMTRWLAFSLLTILCRRAWAVSKVASDGVDANTNQIFFTLGLLPLMLFLARSPSFGAARNGGLYLNGAQAARVDCSKASPRPGVYR